MASTERTLEEQLLEAGNSLLQLPSSVDELLLLLDRVENFLSRVEQSPSEAIQTAVSASTKALVAEELLRHPDADVKVAVASCISEITRITAPDAPYDDDQMKDVFQLIVSSFENLSDKSSRSYHRRTMILETVARVRSCVVMLDLECDKLIIEMFQHFLKAIRDYHPENVFASMETIMTLVLEESEDISFELISPVLDSVKKDNQEVLPIARKLGKRVFENCAVKLKPYLIQAKRSLGFSLDDYSKIITYICEGKADAVARNDDNACGEQMAEESKLSMASPQGAAQAGENKFAEASSNDGAQDQVTKESMTETRPLDRSPKSSMSNGVAVTENEDGLAEPESSKKPEHAQQADQSVDTNVVNAEPDDSDSGKIVKSEFKFKKTAKKRGRKLDSLLKSTEPSDSCQIDGDKDAASTKDHQKDCSEEIRSLHSEEPSGEVVVPSEKAKETIQLSSPKALDGEPMNVASSSPIGNVFDEGHPKKAGQNKEILNQEGAPSTDVSKKASEVTSDIELKPKRRSRKKSRAGSTPEEKAHAGSTPEEKAHAGSIPETPALADTPKSEGGATSESEARPLKQSGRKADVKDNIGDGSSSKKEDGKRRGRGKATSAKDVTKASFKDVAKEMVPSPKPASKLAKDEGQSEEFPKTVSKRKRTLGKERASDSVEYGANLVDSKVKVWWPDDEMFYEGIISSFDPAKQKHTVLYTDGDKEILNLREEKWEFVKSDYMQDEEQVTECRPDPSPEMHKKKKAKTNSELAAAKQGKMGSSRGGETSSSKLKGAATKSGHKSSDDSKVDGRSKDHTPKPGGKSEDENGGKSKDRSKRSSGLVVSSKTHGKSNDVDGGTPKTSTKSKQDTPKTATKDAPKTATTSKGKGFKSGNRYNSDGSGKARSASGKVKETEGKEKSPETVITPGGDTKKSGKKRQRGAKG